MSLPLINGGDDIENEESKFINMVYNCDWSSTSLGPIDTWDPVLKHITNLILNSKFSFAILINPPDWILLYNQAPLTSMISPLDDVINACSQESSHLQIIRRNARRLLKLINALLQFSYIESNQLKAHYREINIAKFTQELASKFKSMAKTLGLDYNIDIPNPEEFNHAIGDKIL
ncbi:hypothetical protein C2G38_2148152 [Gigaspora rosea]|uniref:Uncharacterized protein n=1 Tax=Gigaspora rosea TaxID=44941 RepID=A0A397U7G3_9GLOM|nr:hypothetical protein C2G38_2148152 [Gigaspora rosea]